MQQETLSVMDTFSVAQFRRFYAEELRVVANLKSSALVDAFARVERETYLGPGPWRFSSQAPSKDGSYRVTSNVCDLYHDVFVAIKSEKYLNNGQPSAIAGCLGKLDIAPGQKVLHIGCGTGYYTAVIAEVVGPSGSVTAFEIEPDLASAAACNLSRYSHVSVHSRDGQELRHAMGDAWEEDGSFDAIWVNAGVTHPHPDWIAALRPGGRLMLPLIWGPVPAFPKALFVQIERRGASFEADMHSIFTIYQSRILSDPLLQKTLEKCIDSRQILRLKSARTRLHQEGGDCLVHSAGFCLSAASSC